MMAEEQPKKKRKKEKEEEKKNMADSSVNKEAEEMIEKALINGKCVISVIGDHAGLSVDENYRGKIEDIQRCGETFWLCNSAKCRCPDVQEFCKGDDGSVYMIWIDASTKGGAKPTSLADQLTHFSQNGESWSPIPHNIVVTGKQQKNLACFIFDSIVVLPLSSRKKFDLWDYAEPNTLDPIKFRIGASTCLAVRHDTSNSENKMKGHMRNVVAVARLRSPHCVFIKRVEEKKSNQEKKKGKK